MVLIIAGTTASSLLIVRSRLQQHVQETLAADLRHSVETFQDLEAHRRSALEQEISLLASLPSLKALMTTSDARTIADGAVDFWKTSGNDLFALADANNRLLSANAQSEGNTSRLKSDLQAVIGDPSRHYLLSGGRLYEYSVRPLYFGSAASGTVLGYVVSGYAVDHRLLQEVGRGAGAEAAFVTGKDIVASTLAKEKRDLLQGVVGSLRENNQEIVSLGRERYLATTKDMTNGAGAALRLVVMKSFNEADRTEGEINRLVFLVSLLAIAVGSLLMLLLARMVTRPLELLATGVQAFGEGDPKYLLPSGGTQEVRYLSRVFAEMRDEIQKKNRALVESERLATIGRMASSVSHDLRHYLAAVYANAEFLASPALPASERAELFDEIRLAVNGTTDMLDSLLLFGRTGAALQRVPTSMTALVNRAVSLVRTHPDAELVTVRVESKADVMAAIDTRQMERAIYNLLLNGCQSARQSSGRREVTVAVSSNETTASVTITDTGLGVAEGIRENLFDPFVSLGKQKGTGLGLTLASSVAREHDGSVEVVSSRPGEAVFRLTVSRVVSSGTKNNATTAPSIQLTS
ncbi:MAG TPA: ATP-binding protein [Acidobacteriaceae bacterium]|nr:ATP-binding protein [Acidobacteriaceae bacterium]